MSGDHPNDFPSSPDDPDRAAPRSEGRRRRTSRATADRVLSAAAADRAADVSPAVVTLHRRILLHGPRNRSRLHWDTARAALVAAASVDAATEPIVAALRIAETTDAGRALPAIAPLAVVNPARMAVALAGSWAWCALLCQCADDRAAVLWAAGACRATRHAIERRPEDGPAARLDDAVGQVHRSLLWTAAHSSDHGPRADEPTLPRIAIAIGALGATYRLLDALAPR